MRNSVNWPNFELPPINLYSFAKECSPCIGKCKLVDGVCSGCKRTKSEITNWTLMRPIERYTVIMRLETENET